MSIRTAVNHVDFAVQFFILIEPSLAFYTTAAEHLSEFEDILSSEKLSCLLTVCLNAKGMELDLTYYSSDG